MISLWDLNSLIDYTSTSNKTKNDNHSKVTVCQVLHNVCFAKPKISEKELNVLRVIEIRDHSIWKDLYYLCDTRMIRAHVPLHYKNTQAERNTILTWYCGLYQCFKSQSHKIIWKTQGRHIKCQSNVIIVYVHNREYKMCLHRKSTGFDLCSTFKHTITFQRGHWQVCN